jgi:hypothetical protein
MKIVSRFTLALVLAASAVAGGSAAVLAGTAGGGDRSTVAGPGMCC